MTRQHLINLLVLLALVAGGFWVAHNTHWEMQEQHTPPKGDAATNEFYAAQHLAEALGAHTQVRQEVVSLPSTQAVIVLQYWNWDIIPERRARLQQWVNSGGRLVVAQYLTRDEDFDKWTGVRALPEPEVDRQQRKSAPTCGPLTRRLKADETEHFDVCNFFSKGLNTTRKFSWRLLDRDGHAQALRIPIGRGSVTILNTAMAFTNYGVLCGDTGALLVAATQLRRGDEINFITESHGGSLLGLLWRYGSPVVMLAAVLIALWLWRSGVRFGPLVAPTDPARRSLAEQIRGTGLFTMRFGGGAALYAATVRALNEVASRNLPHYEKFTEAERIAALATLTRLSATELATALQDQAARKPQEIRKTIAFLEAARRRILARIR